MKNFLLLFAIYILAATPNIAQDTIRVPLNYPTIQAAIDAASNGDVVLVAEGTYYENLQITSKSITLGSHFLIYDSTKYISNTIIDGSQPVNPDLASVIRVRWSTEPTVICGFTITGGKGTKNPVGERVGGGINAVRSSVTICDNRIINNTLIENEDAGGGGISIYPFEVENLTIIVRNNIIADNYAESKMTSGGGILMIDEYPNEIDYLIENNIIYNNIIQNTDEWKAMGGGIMLSFYLPTSGSQVIRNNLITGNEARCPSSFGGGMYIIICESISDGSVDNDPGPYIYNNIISNNHSDYLGGGVSMWRVYWPFGSDRAWPLTSWGHYKPKPSFVNNTIVDNTAEDGAGFFIMNHIPFVMNNILWNDYPLNAEWGEIFLGDEPWWLENVEPNNYGGAKMFYNDIQGGWDPDSGEGNINFDPMFEDTLLNLSDSSYCVGNGTDSIEVNGIYYTFSSIDFNGNVRPNPIDSYIDIGAKESPYEKNQVPIGVKDNSNELPVKYSLQQNYPNPFNPSTIISWQSPVGSHQTIKIFDVLGNEIATLVDEYKPAGKYVVEFNAEKFSSGIYFYQLKAGEYLNAKKMILLR